MTEHVNGQHLGEDGHLNDFDASLEIAGAYGSVTMLSTIIKMYPYIRAKYPHLRINLRHYVANWTLLDPREWARQNFAVMKQYGMLSDANLSAFGYNEMDLASEGWDRAASLDKDNLTVEEYDFIFNTQFEYVDEMQRLKAAEGGVFLVGCLAGADGHEPAGYPPDYQYSLASCKAVVDRADIIWGHAYGELGHGSNPDDDIHQWKMLRPLRRAGYQQDVQGLPVQNGERDPGGFHSQYPNKPYALTECGNGAHGDVSATAATMAQMRMALSAYAKAACRGVDWFIFDAGDNHGLARLAGNWDLIDALRAMERIDVAEVPPVAIEWTLGFAEYAKKNKLKPPILALSYDDFGNAWQYNPDGLLFWYKRDNQIFWFPK